MEMCGSMFWWILKLLVCEWIDSAPKFYLWVNTYVSWAVNLISSRSWHMSPWASLIQNTMGFFPIAFLESLKTLSICQQHVWVNERLWVEIWQDFLMLSMCQQVSLYSSPYVSQDSIQTNRSKVLSIGYQLQAVNLILISRLWRCDLVVLDIWVNEHLWFKIQWDFFRSLFWRAWKRYLYICWQVSNLHTWVNEHLWDFNAIYVSTGLYASPCHESRYDEIFQTGFSESLKMLSTYQQVSRHARATEGLSVRLGLGLRRVHRTRTDTISRYISK